MANGPGEERFREKRFALYNFHIYIKSMADRYQTSRELALLEDGRQHAEARFLQGKPATALYIATALCKHILLKRLPRSLLKEWIKTAQNPTDIADAHIVEHMHRHAQADTISLIIKRLRMTQAFDRTQRSDDRPGKAVWRGMDGPF